MYSDTISRYRTFRKDQTHEISNNTYWPADADHAGGGNLIDFERLTGWASDRVLYIGDHIYGDILKSKKTSS
ncbi:MAG: 5'-nucleotidase domain-containing protein, partial [Balneolaceae bacterium]|nr:5'-nucleotidase domain-containing protein [Balneolaceae bacterium]